MKGEYGEAAQVLLKASEINPKSPTTLYYLGYSLAKLNYNKAALIPLNQALLIAPTSVQVLFVVGTTEIAEGKYTDAEKHLTQAKTLSKTSVPDIHWHLAHLYADNLKKYKEAADELELYLKSGKFEDKHTEQVRKIITDLRKKSQAQGMNK
jgi:tetratricopeptide (TPR) repeat protein